MSTIVNAFNETCPLVFDKTLISKIRRYEQWFVNKNENHVNFFGGILMGVHPIRFNPEDRYKWFEEIVGTDEFIITQTVHRLDAINTSWNVSSDIFNLSCFWLMHRFISSTTLSEAEKEEGALLVAKVMNYKFFSSTLTSWFSYNANPEVAQTTYNLLTKKFGLKVAGSWGALINHRSYDIVKKGGLHYNVLLKGTPDKGVVDAVNDIWNRVKSILKYIRDVFTIAQNMPELQIQTSSNTIILDGEVRLRDKTRSISQYMDYILSTLSDKRNFYKRELLNVVVQVMGNVPIKNMELLIDYVVNNSSVKADKDIQEFCKTVVEHGINYITVNPTVMRNKTDLAGLVRKMRALYMAAKTNDPAILKIRTLGDGIASRGGNTRNAQTITTLRNSLALYVLLRTMVMHHYQS